MKHNWHNNSKPEYRTPNWSRNDCLQGGSIERHEDCYGRNEYVRRNWVGDVVSRTKPDWDTNGEW